MFKMKLTLEVDRNRCRFALWWETKTRRLDIEICDFINAFALKKGWQYPPHFGTFKTSLEIIKFTRRKGRATFIERCADLMRFGWTKDLMQIVGKMIPSA